MIEQHNQRAFQFRERVREEIQRVFSAGSGSERLFFVEKSNQMPDHPALTLVVLAPEQSAQKTAEAYLTLNATPVPTAPTPEESTKKPEPPPPVLIYNQRI